MFATLLGKGFSKFINLFRRGNINGLQMNKDNEYDISKMNIENSMISEKEFKTNNESPSSSKNSINVNNLNFTPYYIDSPKENRIHAKKIVTNFRNKFTYLRQFHKFYLNPFNKIKAATDVKDFSSPVLDSNSTEIVLIPNQIQNRIFKFQKSANNPIEDRINSIQLKNLDGYLVSVLDGHGGDYVAEFVNQNLHHKFEERINQIKNNSNNLIEEYNIKEALAYAFDQIEREYYEFTLDKFHKGEYKFAFIGSCVLCIVVLDNHIYIANCGDSKAKLYRKQLKTKNSYSTKYDPIKISNTHNAGKYQEQIKLKEKFKTEKDIIIDKGTSSYVKGRLQPTRTIGDLFLKHKEFNEVVLNDENSLKYSRKMLQNFRGPYIEHSPEIFKFEITGQDEFIVLASDGLWDWLDGYDVANALENFSNDGLKVIDELSRSALTKAALKSNLTVEELDHLPISIRRSIYDDISIIVVDLKNQVASVK